MNWLLCVGKAIGERSIKVERVRAYATIYKTSWRQVSARNVTRAFVAARWRPEVFHTSGPWLCCIEICWKCRDCVGDNYLAPKINRKPAENVFHSLRTSTGKTVRVANPIELEFITCRLGFGGWTSTRLYRHVREVAVEDVTQGYKSISDDMKGKSRALVDDSFLVTRRSIWHQSLYWVCLFVLDLDRSHSWVASFSSAFYAFINEAALLSRQNN